MRCPKCSCEVGNQAVCPFCGATVYLSNPTWMANDYAQRATVPVERRRSANCPDPERRMRSLETKVNMLLVLQCGTFALTLLALVSMLLK